MRARCTSLARQYDPSYAGLAIEENTTLAALGIANLRFFHAPKFNSADSGVSKRTITKEKSSPLIRAEFFQSCAISRSRVER